MVTLFPIECSKCKAKNRSGAKFCGECGEPLPGSEAKCGNCGAMVPADKKFCGSCGKPMGESAAPLLTGNRWARRIEDYATKVEVSDVEGFFKKGLIVEAGTRAIFFVNGAFAGILEPGKYDMGGLIEKVKNLFNSKSTTAVLVDTGDVELHFSLADLQTHDPLTLTAECRLVVQMDNPTAFFENLMKGRQNYPLSELNGFLEDELRNCLQEFVGSKSVQELSSSISFKQQIEQGIAQHLAKTFGRKGLSFIQARVFDFRHPRMNALTKVKEEYWVYGQELETALAGGAIAGLERKVLDQDTAKALMQVEVFEERAKVFERMRKATASNEMDKVTQADQLESFLQGIDKNRLVRKDEMDTLTQDFAEKKEDHDLARQHTIQKLRLGQEMEQARAQAMIGLSVDRSRSDAQREEEMAQVEHQLSARRKLLEQQQADEWAAAKQEADVQRYRIESQIGLAKQKKVTEIELDELEDQADVRTATASLDLLKKQKAIKKEEADWELERELRARSGVSELSLKEEAQRHKLELEKIQVMSTLSTEALIASAPAERAAMLAELKRTESLKGFSEDQILAMAADKNSEIAKAFQEKFKNASSGDIQRAYDKMLAMKDQNLADIKEMSREHARMVQDMYNKGMEMQRDTASRAAAPGMTVITPGGAAGVVQTGPAGEQTKQRIIVCPKCHLETAEGSKFCENCGNKFFD
jgi:hypothetical protein